jgi:uncharacterized OsmC-like protein
VKVKKLEDIQKPIKQAMAEDPLKAQAVLHADGVIGPDFNCMVTAYDLQFEAGLPKGVGGREGALSPGTVFLASICACSGVTMSVAADYLGIDIKYGKVTASGKLDLRGTMGISDDVPVGFKDIDLNFELETDADDAELSELLMMTEKFSVTSRTIADGTEVNYRLERW